MNKAGMVKEICRSHNSLIPVSSINSWIRATISSRLALVSSKVAPSGAMSRSWKQK